MVYAAGHYSRTGNAGPRQGAHGASRIFVCQSQSRARLDPRVRAGKPREFNRADGAGYDFIADTVLALDRKNPQLAAKLLAAMKSWRVLEPGRRAMAEKALQQVASAPSRSPDVADIVQRALATR